MIYNKKQYKNYIRSLYSNDTVVELDDYQKELANSEQKRNELKRQIKSIQAQALKEPDSSSRNILLYELKNLCAKRGAIPSGNDFQVSRFMALSTESRQMACTSFLLNRYLTDELIKNNPLKFETTSKGDVIVDIEKLKESHLHELAVDIRDFVKFYFQDHEEEITQAKYFLDKYKNIADIYELNKVIDHYYAKQRTTLNDYEASRTDVKQVAKFSDKNTQILQLTGPHALSFFGDKMGVCLGKPRYAELMANDPSAEFYVIANLKRNQPNYPYVIMFFKDNKVAEVVGKCNHAIADIKNVRIARDFIKEKLSLESDAEVANSGKIPEIAKRNLGVVTDKSGIYRDLYNLGDKMVYFDNLPVTGHNLKNIELEKINSTKVWLQGNHTPKAVQYLNQIKGLQNVVVAVKYNFGVQKSLDMSSLNVTSLDLTSTNLHNIETIKFPKTLTHIKLNNMDLSKIKKLDFGYCDNLQEIELRNSNLENTTAIRCNLGCKIDTQYAKMSNEFKECLSKRNLPVLASHYQPLNPQFFAKTSAKAR